MVDGFLDYKVDAEIRTLDLSKVDIEEELDEDVMEDIMDSFKMLFSSGIAKGKVEVGQYSATQYYLNGFGIKDLNFSFKKGEEGFASFKLAPKVIYIPELDNIDGITTARQAISEIITDLDESEMLFDSLDLT